MTLVDTIEAIEFLIQSIVYGATYLIAFRFLTHSKLDYSNISFIIRSIILNYVFLELYLKIEGLIGLYSYDVQLFARLLASLAIAYLASRIYLSRLSETILAKLGIRRTLMSDLLINVMPLNKPIALRTWHRSCESIEGAAYLIGSICKMEEDNENISERHLVLKDFIYVDSNDDVVYESSGESLLIKIGDCIGLQFKVVEEDEEDEEDEEEV